MKKIKAIMIAMTVVLLAISCQKSNNSGAMTLKMTDAPAEWNAVNVDIKQVEIKYTDHNNDSENWIALHTRAGIYNLLEFQDGISTVLVDDQELQVGRIDELRLVLGARNSLVIGDVEHFMKVPSGMSSGIKIKLGGSIKPNQLTEVLIDFDAEKSVVLEGNESFLLKPVIKVESIIYK